MHCVAFQTHDSCERPPTFSLHVPPLTPMITYRFLMTSVFRDKGRTTPCNFYRSPVRNAQLKLMEEQRTKNSPHALPGGQDPVSGYSTREKKKIPPRTERLALGVPSPKRRIRRLAVRANSRRCLAILLQRLPCCSRLELRSAAAEMMSTIQCRSQCRDFLTLSAAHRVRHSPCVSRMRSSSQAARRHSTDPQLRVEWRRWR